VAVEVEFLVLTKSGFSLSLRALDRLTLRENSPDNGAMPRSRRSLPERISPRVLGESSHTIPVVPALARNVDRNDLMIHGTV
jgi:hypothetical protein